MDVPDLTADLILRAYSSGAFPMAESAAADAAIHFYRPKKRALFTLQDFHLPQRVARWLKKQTLTVRYPDDVTTIMQECGRHRDESWINPVLLRLYTQLAQHGFAQAIGVYDGDRLVGGIYWVQIGPAVMAESMFSRMTNASKLALASLMAGVSMRAERLGLDKEKQWIDVQFVNPHLEQFHPTVVSATIYQSFLAESLSFAGDASFLASDFAAGALLSFLQFKTQIS